mgnify:CR=1 FL=1|jgi:hypothetical protein
MEKKILDVTCGSRTIWFNKTHPAAVYCDSRRESYTGIWKSTKNDSERRRFQREWCRPIITGKKFNEFWKETT